MKSLNNLLKQAQEMQGKMAAMQEQMEQVTIQGSSGGGMVMATMNGKGELQKIKIDPKLADPTDVEMLEDLIVAACSDAKAKVEQHMSEEMAKLTSGMPLPGGFKLPF